MPLDKLGQIWLKDVLGKMGIYQDLSRDEREELFSKAQMITFENGEYIIREGTFGDEFFILAKGTVSAVKKGADGREITVGEIESGDYFGETALISDSVRSSSIVARGEVKVFSIGRMDFFDVLMRNEHVREKIEDKSRMRNKATQSKYRQSKYPGFDLAQKLLCKLRELSAQRETPHYRTRILENNEPSYKTAMLDEHMRGKAPGSRDINTL
ncbi:MAG: cyclic nucleotide-binding domain-containing protein [Candidatus Eremiobacteraeota bacterium]|nr:cyclic nucleotide-binding domain-containing protein [Candidatus Eremiobacteraeota bacterium]